MSGDSYAAVWAARMPNPYMFTVGMVLARYQGPDGICRLKQKTIARIAGCSVRQVSKVLQDMRDHSPPMVKVIETRRKDGSQGPNLMQLTLEAHISTISDSLVDADDFYLSAPYAEQHAQSADGLSTPRSLGKTEVQTNSKRVSVSESLVSVPASPDAQHAFNAYNDRAKALGLSVAEKLTETRKKHLNKRLQESGIEGWTRALDAIERSRFLMGERASERGPFKLTLDFLLQAKSFQKLIEGGYDDGRKPKLAPADASKAYQDRLRTDPAFGRTMAHQWTQDPDRWPPEAGPPPGQPGCVLPVEVQANVVDRMRTATHAADALAYALAPSIGINLGREHQPDDEVPL